MNSKSIVQEYLINSKAPVKVLNAFRAIDERLNMGIYDDDNGFAGVSDALSEFLGGFCPYADAMPDAEDMCAKNETAFVGYFVMIKAALERIANQHLAMAMYGTSAPKSTVNTEGALEQWIAEAEEKLPEWAYNILCSPLVQAFVKSDSDESSK